MPTIVEVRCDYCRELFSSMEHATRHEQRCASKPTGALPDEVCGRCGKREDYRERAFIHGDLEPSSYYVHRPDGWKFPDWRIGQHVFRRSEVLGE